MTIHQETHHIDNGDGWQLALHRRWDPDRLDATRRPVVMVPGFAMNAHILGYHPRGPSIAGYIAAAGYDTWCVELRGQGHSVPSQPGASHRRGRASLRPRASRAHRRYGMADLGLVDLAAAIEGVCHLSHARADRVDVIGCSLGATLMFMQAAWWPTHRIARLINLGGPLRWTAVHPAMRALAALPAWGAIPVRGTRHLARAALPIAIRWPALLRLYLNPEICDLTRPDQLVLTVDDPSSAVNAEIARWINRADLIIDGRNLTHDVAHLRLPLLTIVASGDGIVPEATATSAHNAMRGADRTLIHAGTERRPMAHADLFISALAEAQVFKPLVAWLDRPDAAHTPQ